MGLKKKNTKLNTWKPVELDASVFSGGVEGLIGIEECTDYDLNLFSKKPKRKASVSEDEIEEPNTKKKVKKTKSDNKKQKEKEIDKASVSEDEIEEPNRKKKVKKTKNDNKKETVIDQVASTSVPDSIASSSSDEENDQSLQDEDIPNIEVWNEYNLPKTILKALGEQGFLQPTEIQRLTLPAAVLGRRDILGAAETGSGKTLAFGLPILAGILKIKEQENVAVEVQDKNNSDSEESDFEENEEDLSDIDEEGIGCVRSVNNIQLSSNLERKPLYSLILTPTRELAMQVKNHLVSAAKYTGIQVAVVVGGMAAVKQERILRKGPEIVVATPGRLWELIQSGNPHLSQIDNIRFFAIDETDRMLEKGHFQELHDLLERINLDEHKRKLRQNFVFSATLTLVHELPKHLKHKSKKSKKIAELTPAQKLQKIVDMLGISNPKIVDITQGTGTSGTLTECRITCPIEEKDFYVYYFLEKHPGRTLIFCNSIGCVKRLTTLLGLLNCNPLPLHASMQQRQRLKNLERFRDNENSILVATDVAARGLDIPSVEHVLHYQTPRTSESYVHRSGRTARASKQGITILLVEPTELQNYLKLCRTLGKSEDLPIFPVQENYLNAVKQRVNLARELDKLELQVKKTNSENGWLQKAAEDMDIIVDDICKKYDTKEARQAKKIADVKRKQLTSLLAKPVFPKGFSGKYPLSSDISLPFVQGEQKEKAIDVMKNAIENLSKEKKRSRPLFKPNKQRVKKHDGVIKLNKFKKEKNINKKAHKGKRRR